MEMIHQLYRDTSGATIVEYTRMLAGIALLCFASVSLLGSSVTQTFNNNTLKQGLGGS